MDSRRTKLLAVSLAVLSVTAIGLFFFQSSDRTPTLERNDFALLETEKVNRVDLIQAGDTVTLSFDNGRWRVNGTMDADLQMIKVLMATLQQMKPHRLVAAVQQDSVGARLRRTGTRVRVMEGSDVVRDFVAGGNPGKSEAWFLGEDGKAVVMVIPGYRVYVSGIFELQAGGWRNKRIFDFNWRNFKTLTASYSKEPKEGFTVELKRQFFGIRNFENVDTTRLNDYLDAVSLLLAKRFLDRHTSDLVRLQAPVAKIEVIDIANRTWSLELFPPGEADREVMGRLATGDLVMFDRSDIASVVRKRSFFVSSK